MKQNFYCKILRQKFNCKTRVETFCKIWDKNFVVKSRDETFKAWQIRLHSLKFYFNSISSKQMSKVLKLDLVYMRLEGGGSDKENVKFSIAHFSWQSVNTVFICINNPCPKYGHCIHTVLNPGIRIRSCPSWPARRDLTKRKVSRSNSILQLF